jgi:Major Facilitator Superfamily
MFGFHFACWPCTYAISNVSLKLILSSGLITVCQGLVTTKGGLYATRFFLGLAETGMFPGSFYLIGMWYKRHEAQKRFTFFFASTSLAGAFGGLIAAGINNINGRLGHESWSWIFIIEGAITMFFSFILYFWIPDFPENAKFLSPTERSFVIRRLEDDQGVQSGLERRITWTDALACFKDWKIIIGAFMYFGLIVPAYGYAYFAPGIIQAFGYTAVQTQLHSVPPWAASWGWSMLLAWASDRWRNRIGFILLSLAIAIAGFAVLLSGASFSAKYAALHLVTSGVYGAMPIIVCWFNLNIGGHHRRAVGSAWQIGFGNIGGIISTYAFLPKDKPKYVPGYSICLAFVCLSLLSCLAYLAGCVQANKKKAAHTNADVSEKETKEQGDLSPGYRYMY